MNNNADLVRQLLALLSPSETKTSTAEGYCPWDVGTAYLIRTVTAAWTGRLVAVGPHELVLHDAAWIADTGRYAQAVDEASLSEIEPRDGPVVIGRGSVVDAVQWLTPLPMKQK